jgi:hypothetical protein
VATSLGSLDLPWRFASASPHLQRDRKMTRADERKNTQQLEEAQAAAWTIARRNAGTMNTTIRRNAHSLLHGVEDGDFVARELVVRQHRLCR